MADTYTTSLRITQPQVGADTNTWGTLLNTDWSLVESAITGHVAVALTGPTKTLTANNGSTDQSRNQIIEFTGTPGGTCTVTIPAVVKLGIFVNSTGDNSSVILTTGAGATVTLAQNNSWTHVYCNGTDLTIPQIGSNAFAVDSNYYLTIFIDPLINFDLNDYIVYQRSTNKFNFVISGVNAFIVDQNGISTRSIIFGTSGTPPTITTGAGPPLSGQPLGSLYLRTSGGVGSTLYVSQGSGFWAAVAGV